MELQRSWPIPVLFTALVACAPDPIPFGDPSARESGGRSSDAPISDDEPPASPPTSETPPSSPVRDGGAPADAGVDSGPRPPLGCTLTPGAQVIGATLRGNVSVPLAFGPSAAPSIATNGTLGTSCPLRTQGGANATYGFVSSLPARSATVTVQNVGKEDVLLSTRIACGEGYTETGLAYYRSPTVTLTEDGLQNCAGRVDVRIDTPCAALLGDASLLVRPCETVTVLVQNAAASTIPSAVLDWNPASTAR